MIIMEKILLGDIMSKEQKINCDVFDCKHCNCDDEKCNLNEIRVSCCNSREKKESTICDSYERRKK